MTRKPGSRADVGWDLDEPPTPTVGLAEPGDPSSFAGVAAVLWVPDPEQRHGWREVYVKRGTDKPGRRLGFGR